MEKNYNKQTKNTNPFSQEQRKIVNPYAGSSNSRPEEEYNPGKPQQPNQTPSPKPGEFQDQKEKERKNAAEAASKEDWEGGASRPNQDERREGHERRRKTDPNFEQEDENRNQRNAA